MYLPPLEISWEVSVTIYLYVHIHLTVAKITEFFFSKLLNLER